MDSQFSFAVFSFGVDTIIYLIPSHRDEAGGLVSFILLRMRNIGVNDEILNKMTVNVMIDVLVESIHL